MVPHFRYAVAFCIRISKCIVLHTRNLCNYAQYILLKITFILNIFWLSMTPIGHMILYFMYAEDIRTLTNVYIFLYFDKITDCMREMTVFNLFVNYSCKLPWFQKQVFDICFFSFNMFRLHVVQKDIYLIHMSINCVPLNRMLAIKLLLYFVFITSIFEPIERVV